MSLGGCGARGKAKTYPLAGTVTFKGQPLANAVVTFFPASGRPTAGITNSAGEFTLPTGAAAGPYHVTVAEPSPEAKPDDYSLPPETPPRFPAKYTDPNRSGLDFEVKPDAENKFAIELKE
ncbi:MAG TPA: carboxypeptidase-like regulatory domain-containing protein [Pirellulales bacterium]|nr:carboxypeptidase-like regulatory domain-containing protein [Pirellulales bacterium]